MVVQLAISLAEVKVVYLVYFLVDAMVVWLGYKLVGLLDKVWDSARERASSNKDCQCFLQQLQDCMKTY